MSTHAFDIGFTGTQVGCTDEQLRALHDRLSRVSPIGRRVLRRGDCIGADEQAAYLAHSLGFDVICHPPNVAAKRANVTCNKFSYPPLPYLMRNKEIVRMSQALVACPKGDEEIRSGTWSTVRHARLLKRQIWIIMPNGNTRYEMSD